jgi:hypothetical protein
MLDDLFDSREIELIREMLRERGYSLVVTRSASYEDDYAKYAPYAKGIVIQVNFPLDEEDIKGLTSCKIISVTGIGYKKPFGYFLRYFVVSERGFLGCIMFAGPAKALRARDEWIGSRQRQRLKNLAWVINNLNVARNLVNGWKSQWDKWFQSDIGLQSRKILGFVVKML